jgi:A-macroglobulin TED domain
MMITLQGGLEGSEDLTPLTAYALIALLETYGDDPAESVAKAKLLEDTLPCLEPEESGPQDAYTVALTAYALTLAGRLEQARTLIDWLLQRARSDQSMLWWQKAGIWLIARHPHRPEWAPLTRPGLWPQEADRR